LTRDRPSSYLVTLVRELTQLPTEAEWVEFKRDNDDPREIGEYISALSNAAALLGKPSAYLVWGIADGTHEVVGTSFAPRTAKVGNEELENWLLRLLEPKIDFRFFELEVDGKKVVLLEIDRAFRHPVRFQGQELIRVGSYRKNLKDFPEKERELWRALDRTPFETGMAAENLSSDEVLSLLDYPSYFDLMKRPLPAVAEGILAALESDELLRANDAGQWDITNVGALLFAKRLEDFPRLRRKAVRVIQYRAGSRLDTIKGAGRDGGIRFRVRGSDQLYQWSVAGKRGHRAGPPHDGQDVSRACRSRACRECVDPSGSFRDWCGSDGRDFRRSHGDHKPGSAAGVAGTVSRHAAQVPQ
jgi:predicted HTH transcriptional regulator